MLSSVDQMSSQRPLPVEFYDRPPDVVARELLGKLLIREQRGAICVGRIVETEAYLASGDSACHAARGKNRKNASMFGPPGRAYVYPIHSRWCFNTVTEPRGVPSAVLVRAIEPLLGLPIMERRRGVEQHRELANGPAKLCEALAIGRSLDGWNLTLGKKLWLADAVGFDSEPPRIGVSIRIGVTSAEDLPLRFYRAGNEFVSGSRKDRA